VIAASMVDIACKAQCLIPGHAAAGMVMEVDVQP
jgi:uncharacterized cupredoxin-like copper-binding protein